VTSIALKWLNEGLLDRCITRDLSWGVPVERPGYEGKVFYVWFDAPIEYIGATKEWADEAPDKRDWKSWWYATDDVIYTQFMAKDNVPFHTVSFPCTMIGSGEPWNVVDYIKGFNWLTYYGGKFSTSQKRGIFMSDAIELLPADYWRYYLMANAPETSDASFTWESLAATVNKDLADTYGNFVNRAFKLTEKHFGLELPAGGENGDAERELCEELDVLIAESAEHYKTLQFRKAIQALKATWTLGNTYFDRKQPWKTIKEDHGDAACTLRTAINLVRLFSTLALPIIPETAKKALASVGVDSEGAKWPSQDAVSEVAALAPGSAFTVPPPLFAKVTDDQVVEWKERFLGEEES
ncbi:MAG: class I tRNA ligase family protein, partial [Candidatus Hydrogenedentes bacterium]|nr:class I tRNA ligase family protein [Candidatus Hydrogenedentota bacterium]